MKKENNEERFVKTYFQGDSARTQIWVDKLTGVNYLYHHEVRHGGITVLLNSDGTPVITPIEQLGDL